MHREKRTALKLWAAKLHRKTLEDNTKMDVREIGHGDITCLNFPKIVSMAGSFQHGDGHSCFITRHFLTK
jgi:hypothetical protein